MSKTYLQDFGTLRRAMQAREVNDPMSGAGRWEDLGMDLRPPHIPKVRRSPVPSSPSLSIGGLSVEIKAKAVGDVAHALGFHSSGSYKHRLVTIKAETYRSRMEREGRPDQTKLLVPVEREVKFRHDNICAAIRSLVHKVRFSKSADLSSVGDIYREHIRNLWPHRHLTK